MDDAILTNAMVISDCLLLQKDNHVCLKENAVPICPGTDLS